MKNRGFGALLPFGIFLAFFVPGIGIELIPKPGSTEVGHILQHSPSPSLLSPASSPSSFAMAAATKAGIGALRGETAINDPRCRVCTEFPSCRVRPPSLGHLPQVRQAGAAAALPRGDPRGLPRRGQARQVRHHLPVEAPHRAGGLAEHARRNRGGVLVSTGQDALASRGCFSCPPALLLQVLRRGVHREAVPGGLQGVMEELSESAKRT